jgi:hypothetical protein
MITTQTTKQIFRIGCGANWLKIQYSKQTIMTKTNQDIKAEIINAASVSAI